MRTNGLRRFFTGISMIGVLAGTTMLTAAPAHASILFSDGSFETPVVTPSTFQRLFAGQTMGAWQVTSGSVDLIGAGFWQAAKGVQSLDLDGGDNGTIEQTFTTIPLNTYEVSYALAGNPASGPTVKTGEAFVNGALAQNFSFDVTGKTLANMGYVHREFTFVATGLATTVRFASTTTPGGFGPVLDDVDVESCLLIICL